MSRMLSTTMTIVALVVIVESLSSHWPVLHAHGSSILRVGGLPSAVVDDEASSSSSSSFRKRKTPPPAKKPRSIRRKHHHYSYPSLSSSSAFSQEQSQPQPQPLVPVPYVKQYTEYSCGDGSLNMVLCYAYTQREGIIVNASNNHYAHTIAPLPPMCGTDLLDQRAIINVARSTNYSGTYVEDIVRTLRFSAISAPGQPPNDPFFPYAPGYFPGRQPNNNGSSSSWSSSSAYDAGASWSDAYDYPHGLFAGWRSSPADGGCDMAAMVALVQASGSPLIMLMWYDDFPSDGGHFRVLIGGHADPQQPGGGIATFLDPWDRDGQPRVLPLSFAEACKLWNYTESNPVSGYVSQPFNAVWGATAALSADAVNYARAAVGLEPCIIIMTTMASSSAAAAGASLSASSPYGPSYCGRGRGGSSLLGTAVVRPAPAPQEGEGDSVSDSYPFSYVVQLGGLDGQGIQRNGLRAWCPSGFDCGTPVLFALEARLTVITSSGGSTGTSLCVIVVDTYNNTTSSSLAVPLGLTPVPVLAGAPGEIDDRSVPASMRSSGSAFNFTVACQQPFQTAQDAAAALSMVVSATSSPGNAALSADGTNTDTTEAESPTSAASYTAYKASPRDGWWYPSGPNDGPYRYDDTVAGELAWALA